MSRTRRATTRQGLIVTTTRPGQIARSSVAVSPAPNQTFEIGDAPFHATGKLTLAPAAVPSGPLGRLL